jgi:hypothetical protein
MIVCRGYSQTPIHSVAKSYLRIHPFDSRFSSFIQTLQKDPWFTMETYERRTDSTFFFLEGIYKNFNPFRFIPKEIRFVIAEEEIIHADSLNTHDTIINLQLMAVADSGEASIKAVEKEFKRFHNAQADRFSSNTYDSYNNKQGKKIAEISNYFILPYSIAPVTIAWGVLPDTNYYTFTITIRFKIKQNMAEFIVSPGEL